MNFTLAGVGAKATSLTTEFCRYPMDQALQLNVYDTMGIDPDIQNTCDVNIDNILLAVDGHVPHGYKFNPEEQLQENSERYISEPTLANRPHCVAVVVNAQKVHVMEENMIEKLKRMADGLQERKIPLVVLLTHMDEFCPEVEKNTTNIFHSIAVEGIVNKVSKMVHGLPENFIFPVINYVRQVELDDDLDILILYALRQMLRACSDYLENHENQQTGETPTPARAESPLKFGEQEEGDLGPRETKIPTECSKETDEDVTSELR